MFSLRRPGRHVYTFIVNSSREPAAFSTSSHHATHKIGILGAPFHKGQPKTGTDLGPQMIRNKAIIESLQAANVDVVDYGDVIADKDVQREFSADLNNASEVFSYCEKLHNSVKDVVHDGRICLTLGGDHCIAVGSVLGHAGASQRPISLLWVDAHADINTGSTSFSKNMHGMPVSYMLHEMKPHVSNHLPAQAQWIRSCLPARNLAYVGIRDLDPPEKDFLKKLDILSYDVRDVQYHGMEEIMSRVLYHLNPLNENSLHISFDVDAMDPTHAPSTGTPAPEGLSLLDSIILWKVAMKTGQVGAIDVVEFNPLLGSSNDVRRTADTTKQLIMATAAV